MTSGVQRRLYTCDECQTDTWSATGEPSCDRCGKPMHLSEGGPSILPPHSEPVDDTLTAYLAAPLPDEALARSENPANLFGKYVLLRELGCGATGTVIKAWDTYLSRHVALKFLRSTPTRNVEMESTERVQSFLREARLAARLSHPNIVTIYEVDYREGRYYISMDFVAGGTLSNLIHGPGELRGRTRFYQEPERFLTLLRTIALAVHHAHAQKTPVVHRDLKPQNVLLDGAGKPFVADFGLANEVRVDGERQEGVRGTPAYMAPEQVLGETREIDARTDVYALGVILYEMLSGEVPFRGENIPSIMRKVVEEPPVAPSAVVARAAKRSTEVAGCPHAMRVDLEAVCLKALSKKKELRYQSALEFADALQPWLRPISRGAEPAASPAPATGRRKARLAVLSIALVVALIVAAGRLRSTAPAAPPGNEVATMASGLLADGKWTSFRGALAELRRRAPDHPRLPEFERALAGRDERIEQSRMEWAAAMEGLATAADPEELRRRLDEFNETGDEFRASLRKSVDRWGQSLLESARALCGDGPSDAWISSDAKKRGAELLQRLESLEKVVASTGLDPDPRTTAETRGRIDQFLAYRGRWTLRANVSPYAELRVLRGGRECARDVTPAVLKALDLNAEEVTLELFWPSARDPQRRWSAPLRDLRAGERVVVSGSLESMDIKVERK